MHAIDRRAAVAGLALLWLCPPARAATPEQLSIDADEGPVALTRYAAEQAGKRASLLGFSLGGYVAAATAARDERVAALGVLYGGICRIRWCPKSSTCRP